MADVRRCIPLQRSDPNRTTSNPIRKSKADVEDLTIKTALLYSQIMNIFYQYKGLPSQIYYLSISRMITEMGVMFVFPFMSLLLTQRLGFTEIQAGYFLVFTSIGNMAGSLIGGKLCDEFGRRIVYSVLTMIIVISMLIGGRFCMHRIVILFVFISYSATSALMPVVSAMIIDQSTAHNRSECFSLLYLAGNIGCALGPVLAGLLFYNHMPWVFYCQAFFFLAAFVLVITRIEDSYIPNRHRMQEHCEVSSESLLSVTLHRPVLLAFLLILVALTACYIEMDYVFPLQLNEAYGLNLGSKLSSGVWTLNGIAVILLTPWIVAATKKNSALFNLIFAGTLFAVGYFLYSINVGRLIFIVAPFLWTAGEILLTTYSGVFIAEVSPDTHKGRCMSLYEFTRGIGKCIGPVIFGYVITYGSYRSAWVIVSVVCLICSLLTYCLYRKNRSL